MVRVTNSFLNSTTTIPQFNPARFTSALTEWHYPKGPRLRAKLNAKRNDLVDRLRKKPDDDEAADLATKLEACKKHHRCQSAACPNCARAAKRFCTKVIREFLRHHPDRDKIVCVSVVPADGTILKGELTAEQHVRNVRRWKGALGHAGVTCFVGATDWSFNEHTDGRYQPGWQEHFYGFTVTDDPKELKKQLKEQFRATDAIPRPVQVKVWDGDQTAIEYMLKTDFRRRIGTDDGQRRDNDGDGSRECRATDKQPLRKSQKHELMLHLDEIGLQGRLLMRWLQIVNLADSGWTIVDRAPKVRVRGNGGSV
jgi:hypothetical protein